MADTYRFIGRRIPRKDAVEIVTGRARFLDDITLPNMLHGQVLRSPHAHAIIKKVDINARHEAIPSLRGSCKQREEGTVPIL